MLFGEFPLILSPYRRQSIAQTCGDAVKWNFWQGQTIYPALVRLEDREWIRSRWGISENNRRARFYELTKRGRKQITRETENWFRVRTMMDRFLEDA